MATTPYEITIVSHTHWDREWYQPFQVFRFQLIELIDYLLDLLDRDPDYRSFLLDGQTIILEDYLAMRPDREADLKRYIAEERLLIGPWHILPDEFLVSAEATVRNLMLGAKVCAQFGTRMPVGYTPDPFGHISQLPQILAGCGLPAAALQRGLSDEPPELWWEAPDGTRLLLIYFRAGYGNLAWAPTTPDAFTRAVEVQIDRLAPHSHTSRLLMLNGTDHMMPQAKLPELIAQANQRLEGRAVIRHGTLPEHVAAVRDQIAGRADALPVVHGELRSPKRFPVLPGVYSARLWIKQANRANEIALERYAEPVSALAQVFGGKNRSGELWQAWRYLIENHPHDSICGCSIDQVHDEMRTRFAWSHQIADKITTAGLEYLATRIDRTAFHTQPAAVEDNPPAHAVTSPHADMTVLVYNPLPGTQREIVAFDCRWPGPRRRYELQDDTGRTIPYRVLSGSEIIFEDKTLAPEDLDMLFEQIEIGFYKGRLISDVSVWFDGSDMRLEMVLPEYHTGEIGDFSGLVKTLRSDPRLKAVTRCHLITYLADMFRLSFVAEDVPGVGYRAYHLTNVPDPTAGAPDADTARPAPAALENEWLRVEADPRDGTLRLTDKSTGRVIDGLNRLEDSGDRGDEYNFCPPAEDAIITQPIDAPVIQTTDEGVFGQEMTIHARYRIPADLTPDRAARTSETVELPVVTTVRLVPGQRRVDIRTTLDNAARNHRVRVQFPCGVRSEQTIVDEHFDRLVRGPLPAVDTDGWAEQPTATAAHSGFVAVEQAGAGLLVATRGLPEYEHITSSDGSTLAITLLRAVGWLSRDDLVCRPGHAGPARATPGAQCLGSWTCEYSLIPFGDDAFPLAQAAWDAYAFLAPLHSVATVSTGGDLPPALQWVTLDDPALVLTAVKPAEDGQGVVVRFYNSSDQPVSGRLITGLPVESFAPVNLLEEPAELAWDRVDDRTFAIEAPGKRIITARLTFAGS